MSAGSWWWHSGACFNIRPRDWAHPSNDLLIRSLDLKNWQITGLSPPNHSSNIRSKLRKVVEITQDFCVLSLKQGAASWDNFVELHPIYRVCNLLCARACLLVLKRLLDNISLCDQIQWKGQNKPNSGLNWPTCSLVWFMKLYYTTTTM